MAVPFDSLQDFIKTNPPANYASPANGLLGTAYENTGKFLEAAAAYRKAADLATLDYLKASALLDQGRALRLGGKKDEAIAVYQEVLTKQLRVMDASAVAMCRDNRMPVLVFNMHVSGNILRMAMGETVGTVIS